MADQQPEAKRSWPEWLTSQLASRNITGEELAVLLRTDFGVVSDWLAGWALPSSHDVDRLAALLSLEKLEVEARVKEHVVGPPEVALDPFSEVLDEVRARAADL